MPTGYCTVDDVRRVFQEADLTGAISEDPQMVVDAITGLTEPVEKATRRHWYMSTAPSEDNQNLIDTDPNTRNDEHDLSTHGGFVHGASELDRHRHRANSDALLEAGPRYDRRRRGFRRPKRELRIAFGGPMALEPPVDETVPAYTRITLNRKDVTAVNELSVVNEAGGYDDWTVDKTGGVGNQNRGEDYWVRINNGGRAELYLDVHAMDDQIPSFSNAVYLEIDYGHEGIPGNVRRGVAFLAASELIVDDEAVAQIPDQGQLVNVETKAERWERLGVQKLEPYVSDIDADFLESYL